MDWEQEQEWQGYLAISHSTCLLDSFHADLNGSTYLELFRTLTLLQWITLDLRGVMPKLCLEVVSALLIPFYTNCNHHSRSGHQQEHHRSRFIYLRSNCGKKMNDFCLREMLFYQLHQLIKVLRRFLFYPNLATRLTL